MNQREPVDGLKVPVAGHEIGARFQRVRHSQRRLATPELRAGRGALQRTDLGQESPSTLAADAAIHPMKRGAISSTRAGTTVTAMKSISTP